MEVLSSKIVNKVKRPVKILQVGEGNFLRGFCDYFFNVLNKETEFNGNIVMVQPRDTHKIGRFNTQDCLYDVITEGICDNKVVSYSNVIDCIDQVIDPYETYDAYLDFAKSDTLKVFLSNTTESGIYFEDKDTDLTKTPISFPAKLLAFLKARYDYFNGSYDSGLYIIPTELITNNGDTLKEVLKKLAKINNFDSDFIEWMFNANKFYNTLVDRIIPGFPKDDIDKWQEKWNYIDNLAVKGEVYHLWCLEGDKSLFDVLPFDKTNLNIILCDDISPYKERKVKILNGSHTFMLPTVYQLGYRVVNKTIVEENVKTLLNAFLDEEVLPSIVNLSYEEKDQFRNDVLDRFANPTIQHQWTSIMLNSMSKYKERILPVVKHYYENKCSIPKYSLFALASLFTLYKLNVEQDNKLFSDDAAHLEMWSKLFDGTKNNEEIINHALSIEFWEYDFSKLSGAKEYVLKCFNDILDNGMEDAVNKLLITE